MRKAMFHRVSQAFALAVLLFPLPLQAQVSATPEPACVAPPETTRLDQALSRTARRLVAREPLTIVRSALHQPRARGQARPQPRIPAGLRSNYGRAFPAAS